VVEGGAGNEPVVSEAAGEVYGGQLQKKKSEIFLVSKQL